MIMMGLLTLMLIVTVVKIVGVLLITSLLIIPPAAARRMADPPERMALLASLIGAASILIGLIGAFYLDAPVGPTIVVCATLVFLVIFFAPVGQKD